jgi:hypothetical protein
MYLASSSPPHPKSDGCGSGAVGEGLINRRPGNSTSTTRSTSNRSKHRPPHSWKLLRLTRKRSSRNQPPLRIPLLLAARDIRPATLVSLDDFPPITSLTIRRLDDQTRQDVFAEEGPPQGKQAAPCHGISDTRRGTAALTRVRECRSLSLETAVSARLA